MCKILFAYPNKAGYPIIPIGISLLSAILKQKGHGVDLFDVTFMVSENSDHVAREKTKFVQHVDVETYWRTGKNLDINDEFRKKIISFNPDLIAFSIVEDNYGCARGLFRTAKETKNIPVLVGGIFPTVAPEFFIGDKNVDLICVGEGEQAIAEIAERIDNRNDFLGISNIIVKYPSGEFSRGNAAKFYRWDPLVFQDRKMFDQRHLFKPFMGKMPRSGNFELSRGCPYGCSYCNNPAMQKLFRSLGNYRREKPVKSLIKEISFAAKECELDLIFFNDENFLQMSQERFDEFCVEYKNIGLPFFIQTRADTLLKEDRVRALKDTGCVTIGIGVEHGSEIIRKTILNKHVSNQTFERAFANCNKIGLRTTAYVMIGLPFETEKNIMETVELCKRIKAASVAISIFAPYHGTELRKICIKNGFMEEGYNENISVNYHSSLTMPQISKERIEELYYKIHDLIYS